MKTNSYNRGMTLIEIAIVLVIIGIVIGLGAAMVGPLTKRAKINDTKEIVNADVESVISFAASNRRLPVPTGTEFTNNVRNPNDAWTKPLYYIIDTNPNTTLSVIPTGSSDAICGRRTTTYTICRDALCTTNIQNVAFIVASGAENFNLQTGIQAGGVGGCPAGQTCVRVYDVDTAGIDDCTIAANCPNYPVALLINRPEAYDDIVKWVTLDELRTKIGCQGAPLKILNNELPAGTTTSYNAILYADGGVPFATSPNTYKWCVNTLPTGLTQTGGIIQPDCSSVAEWVGPMSNTLTIQNAAGLTANSYQITVLVRDNNDVTTLACNSPLIRDSCAQKSFVITISP